jgi:superfamily I DNA/RNA helicase
VRKSPFYVFQDASQAVYRDAEACPEAGFETFYDLVENHRNTRAIHKTVRSLGAPTVTRAVGPEGRPVELVAASDPRAERDALSRVLHRLIRDEAFPPHAIAVLTSSRSVIPELAPEGHIGAFHITSEHRPDQNRVLIESITRFKGLKRDVVVMAGLREVEYCNFGPLLCGGASRARSHLIVIGPASLLLRYESAGTV